MKRKMIMGIIIGIVLIIAVSLLICLVNRKESIVKQEAKEIKSIKSMHYSYSVGYAMYAYYTYDIECNDTCTIKIKPNGYPNEEAKTYELDDKTIKDIIEVLNKYEVSKWDGFKESDPNVLDGDSFSFSLYTKEGDSISASGYMMWPEHYRDTRKELEKIFNSLIKDGDFKKL